MLLKIRTNSSNHSSNKIIMNLNSKNISELNKKKINL